MSLLQISVSSQEDELSVRIVLKGALLVDLGQPLLAFVTALSSNDYAKALRCIDPLRIVNDSTVPALDANHVTEISTKPSDKAEADVIQGADSNNNENDNESLLGRTVKEGLKYYDAEACEEGVNGTYFLKDKEGEMVAVFKPKDEEGQGSPKKTDEDPTTAYGGIKEGEGAIREIAVYLLDKDHFAGVPTTEMIHFEDFMGKGEKEGSIQRFVEHEGSAEDIGPSIFPVHEVHKIGVLDIRILNNDRHSGNILYRINDNGVYELIPIDHGLSLPATLEHVWFDWLTWPQAKQPFDEETKKYIREIDITKDAETLRQLGIREECIQNMIIATTILQKGCDAGLTLYDIGNIVSRTDLEEPSKLELLIQKTGGALLTLADENELFVKS